MKYDQQLANGCGGALVQLKQNRLLKRGKGIGRDLIQKGNQVAMNNPKLYSNGLYVSRSLLAGTLP